MSRPKNYWFEIVRKIIRSYPTIKNETGSQSKIYTEAIEKALEETKTLPCGKDRVEAIKSIYFDNRLTVKGVAYQKNYSYRTVQRWTIDFIKLVGKYSGF